VELKVFIPGLIVILFAITELLGGFALMPSINPSPIVFKKEKKKTYKTMVVVHFMIGFILVGLSFLY
jgi:hypothetical protein